MNCRHVQRLLSDHHDEPPTRRPPEKVVIHLRDCDACRRFQQTLGAVSDQMRESAEWQPDPRPDLRRRALTRWHAQQGSPFRHRHSRKAREAFWRDTRLARSAAVILAFAAPFVGFIGWERGRLSHTTGRVVQQPSAHQGPLASSSISGPHRQSDDPSELVKLQPSPDDRQLPTGGYRRAVAANGGNRQDSSRRQTPLLPNLPPPVSDGSPLDERRELATRPWPGQSPDEWDTIEAQVRGTVPVRDDFVQVPFPRLATTSDRQIAQAVESYKREAAVVDTRLAREVTLAFKATALSDLCERLRAETGIRLEAGASVADEKVTLFCRKRPLREVMRQLSRPFGYAWLRSGGSGEYRYELVQDLRSQLLEEELRNRARNEALLALDREMQRYRPYLALSPDEALARSKSAPAEEKKRLENLAGRGWGAIQMYFRISPRDLDTLRAGQGLNFAQDPQQEDQLLPPEIARGVLQSMRDVRMRPGREGEGGPVFGPVEKVPDGVPPTSFPEARARVHLRFGHSELGQFTFDGRGGVYVGSRITIGGGEYATGTSSAVRDPNNAATQAALAREPALTVRVTVKPDPSCGRNPTPNPSPTGRGETVPTNGDSPPSPRRTGEPRLGRGADSGGGRTPGVGGGVPDPKVTSADVLEALHRATGLPIVADAYTRLFSLPNVSLQNVTLFDALNRLADTMRLRWQREKEGGWLQFRSVSHFDDRLKEVPNRRLFRWAASRRQHGFLTLDDLIEIAALTDIQLDSPTMAEGARECFDLVEWPLAQNRNVRPHLRYLATLTPAQRDAALSIEGLPFARLSLAQQQQLLAHLGERLEWAHIQSLEQLLGAAMRVEYSQPGAFRWQIPETRRRDDEHGPPSRLDLLRGGMFGLSPVRERTREAALQAARRFDPGADASQIAPTDLALGVVYMLTDPTTGGLHPFGVRGIPNGARISW